MYYDMYQGTSESSLVIDEESHTSAMRIWEYALKIGSTVRVSDAQELESHHQKKTISAAPNLSAYLPSTTLMGGSFPLTG